MVLTAAATLTAIPSLAQIRTVTSLADDGSAGTLRAQVTAANSPGPTGGGIINFAVSGTITLTSTIELRANVTIDGGEQITISGGGSVQMFRVFSASVNPTFRNVILTGGKGDCGGAIVNHGFLRLINVTVRGNTATNGGGVCSPDEGLTVDSSTFENNSADLAAGRGGAIYLGVEGQTDVVNSTFTNNRAAVGGAIANDGQPVVRISNSTIAGNLAQSGGGLHLGREQAGVATYTLRNDIFSNNAGNNCATTLLQPSWGDLGGNISFPDNTCPGIVADPKLASLASNGGPTQTMALLAGSAAIDHAPDCDGLTADQRGFPRPQGAACDSGSYEKSALAFTWSFGPVNGANGGQAVPIVFGVGPFAGMNIFAAGYPASRQVSCETGQPIGPLTPIDTPGKSGLSFDSYLSQYQINWKTDKSWAGQCRELVVRLTDGVDHTALFQFR